MTATQYLAEAARHDAIARESFERCDTDGWATQAAHGIIAAENRLKAMLAAQDNTWEFLALFDLDGELVAAKRVQGRYGMVWAILATDDPRGDVTGWFSPSKAHNPVTSRRNNARKGYYVGRIRTAARVVRDSGGGTGFSGLASVSSEIIRCDGGFSRDVEIVDNGQ